MDFNPRSPRGERLLGLLLFTVILQFQPSLPARGATNNNIQPTSIRIFQPSLPARGATIDKQIRALFEYISTLAPREGSDSSQSRDRGRRQSISTLAPREGSDRDHRSQTTSIQISTLAPREGSDQVSKIDTNVLTDFNPRSPRGERQGITPQNY